MPLPPLSFPLQLWVSFLLLVWHESRLQCRWSPVLVMPSSIHPPIHPWSHKHPMHGLVHSVPPQKLISYGNKDRTRSTWTQDKLSHCTLVMTTMGVNMFRAIRWRHMIWFQSHFVVYYNIYEYVHSATVSSQEHILRHAKWPSSWGSDPHFGQSTSILLLKLWISTNDQHLELLIPHTLH